MPLVDDVIVTRLLAIPLTAKVETVVVVEAGKVIDFAPPLQVKTLKVFAPVKITAPVPPVVIVILLYVAPPPAKVLLVDEVSVIAIVEV